MQLESAHGALNAAVHIHDFPPLEADAGDEEEEEQDDEAEEEEEADEAGEAMLSSEHQRSIRRMRRSNLSDPSEPRSVLKLRLQLPSYEAKAEAKAKPGRRRMQA